LTPADEETYVTVGRANAVCRSQNTEPDTVAHDYPVGHTLAVGCRGVDVVFEMSPRPSMGGLRHNAGCIRLQKRPNAPSYRGAAFVSRRFMSRRRWGAAWKETQESGPQTDSLPYFSNGLWSDYHEPCARLGGESLRLLVGYDLNATALREWVAGAQ